MSLQLELPPDVESNLLAQASERGLSPEEYAVMLLVSASQGAQEMQPAPKKKALLEVLSFLNEYPNLVLTRDKEASDHRSVDL
jgi:hypothetical protein